MIGAFDHTANAVNKYIKMYTRARMYIYTCTYARVHTHTLIAYVYVYTYKCARIETGLNNLALGVLNNHFMCAK